MIASTLNGPLAVGVGGGKGVMREGSVAVGFGTGVGVGAGAAHDMTSASKTKATNQGLGNLFSFSFLRMILSGCVIDGGRHGASS